MRYAFGQTVCDVVASGLKTFAGAGEGRTPSTPALWPRSRNAVGGQAAERGCAMGRRVPQILGEVARSPGRVFGENKQSCRQEREGIKRMCPICVANMAMVAAGATSSGGLTAFMMSKFCTKKKTNQTRG